jgi:small subunit ribosomal protein S8e
MSVWHGDSHKKKPSGGRRSSHRKKRRFERGSFPAETKLGERKGKIARRRGGVIKVRLLSERNVNVSKTTTGKTERTEIIRVIRNPANVDYDRRHVITKGTLVQTKLGLARVTSRPGQDGLLNAILVPEKAEK